MRMFFLAAVAAFAFAAPAAAQQYQGTPYYMAPPPQQFVPRHEEPNFTELALGAAAVAVGQELVARNRGHYGQQRYDQRMYNQGQSRGYYRQESRGHYSDGGQCGYQGCGGPRVIGVSVLRDRYGRAVQICDRLSTGERINCRPC